MLCIKRFAQWGWAPARRRSDPTGFLFTTKEWLPTASRRRDEAALSAHMSAYAQKVSVVMSDKSQNLKIVPETAIAKPQGFSLDKFKSKRATAAANVETLLGALPHHSVSQAKDFVRLHPNEEEYWTSELCFVNVPIQGMKRDTLHLIEEDLALQFLPKGKILRHRLALATKPFDVFFLAHVPSQNLDNDWNGSNLRACEQGKARWVQVTSLKATGVERYDIQYARSEDAFPEPKWPTQSLGALIEATFSAGRIIEHENHPALIRLIGGRQDIS
jgi:hypothetical protein